MASPKIRPPLEPGDHLTRDEFERRYDRMPELKKAELLEGVVHMPSPVRWNQYAGPRLDLDYLAGRVSGERPAYGEATIALSGWTSTTNHNRTLS